VAADQRSPRDGRFIEILGVYDPRRSDETIDLERAEYWLGVGAQPSPTVSDIIRRARAGTPLTPPEKPEPEAPAEVEEAAAEGSPAEAAADDSTDEAAAEDSADEAAAEGSADEAAAEGSADEATAEGSADGADAEKAE
jgi:small subunit ribosomal protein S16